MLVVDVVGEKKEEVLFLLCSRNINDSGASASKQRPPVHTHR
jgi:hypothetical protein